MSDRRTFLRGLASLPLVGGSITILGRPTKAAVPVTLTLLERYSYWLATEYGETLIELAPFQQPNKNYALYDMEWRREWCRKNLSLNPHPELGRFLVPPTRPPSSRAAVILSAAGLPLTDRL